MHCFIYSGGDNTTFVASYDNKTDSVTMDIYETINYNDK